jgi:hypothetical protein
LGALALAMLKVHQAKALSNGRQKACINRFGQVYIMRSKKPKVALINLLSEH